MDEIALAMTIDRLQARIDSACRPRGSLTQHQFDDAPFGAAYVCIAPGDDKPHGSANKNRVHLCGAAGGLTADGIARIARMFADAGAARYFVWLSPGPGIENVRGWLLAAGLSRVPYVAYPTLVRDASAATPVATGLAVREVDAAEIRRLGSRLDDASWPDFRCAAGAAGFHHFIAFDGDRLVASASLLVFGTLGYLGFMLTREADRGRGAQRALIAARIDRAQALGCSTLASETLSILPVSLGNLKKAGFRIAFEKEVYQAEPTASTT